MQAIKREDEHHLEKHRQILSMIKSQPIDTVFFGDSLIRRWEEHPTLWKTYFSSFNPGNFGMGADRLENMKWRLANGELEGFEPKVLLFLGGTNNLEDQSALRITQSIKEIILLIKERQPKTEVVLLGLLPRNPTPHGHSFVEQIAAINAELESWAMVANIRYLDLGPLLCTAEQHMDRAFSDDGLHLNADGYRRIGPPLQQFLGDLFTL